jgi:hypothetical protein
MAVIGCSTEPGAPEVGHRIPASVQPGVTGKYEVVGGDWTVDWRAYTSRYARSFAIASRWDLEPTDATTLRVVQPRHGGSPIGDRADRFALTELVVLARTAPSQPPQDVTRRCRIRASSNEHLLHHATDGHLAAFEEEGRGWVSDTLDVEHWIELDLPRSLAVTSVILYWPLTHQPGPWLLDPPRDAGLRAERLRFEAVAPGGSTVLASAEVGPPELYDGVFLRQRHELQETPTPSLEHARTFALPPPGPNAPELLRRHRWRLQDHRSPLMGEAMARVITLLGDRVTELPPVVAGTWDALAAHPAAATLSRPSREAMATPHGSLIVAHNDSVLVLGADSLGVVFGLFRLEKLIGDGEAVRERAWTPRFTPRAVCSYFPLLGGPDGMGFPQDYLWQILRSGGDAIYLFQAGPYLNDPVSIVGNPFGGEPGPDEGKIESLNGLVDRCRRLGIGVYVCLTLPGVMPPAFFDAHPEVRGNEAMGPYALCVSDPTVQRLIREGVRSLATAVPGLAGIVTLRSEVNQTCGGRGRCSRCARADAPPDDPVDLVFMLAEEGVAQAGAATRIIAFDWRAGNLSAPEIGWLNPTVDLWLRPDSLATTAESTLLRTRPHVETAPLLAACRDADRRVWIELQVSHPFPLHNVPEVSVPFVFADKIARVRALADSIGVGKLAFAMGNGSGFAPWPMQQLVLEELLWDVVPEDGSPIERIARRWYGPSASKHAVAVWERLSRETPAGCRFDKYLSRFCSMAPPGTFDAQIDDDAFARLNHLVSVWERAHQDLVHLQENVVDADHRATSQIDIDHVEAALVVLRSVRSCADWSRRFGKRPPHELTGSPGDILAARRIIEGEAENAERHVALAMRDPSLRMHPFWRNWFRLGVITDRQRYLATVRRHFEGRSRVAE